MNTTSALLYLPEVVRAFVPLHQPGAFILGDVEGGFRYRSIGRSDTCLRTRLLAHPDLYRFPYFIFQATKSPEEAFALESKWWHDCKAQHVPIENRTHPRSPSHLGLACPYCEFADSWRETPLAPMIPIAW